VAVVYAVMVETGLLWHGRIFGRPDEHRLGRVARVHEDAHVSTEGVEADIAAGGRFSRPDQAFCVEL
jgi:hypothetical protein